MHWKCVYNRKGQLITHHWPISAFVTLFSLLTLLFCTFSYWIIRYVRWWHKLFTNSNIIRLDISLVIYNKDIPTEKTYLRMPHLDFCMVYTHGIRTGRSQLVIFVLLFIIKYMTQWFLYWNALWKWYIYNMCTFVLI